MFRNYIKPGLYLYRIKTAKIGAAHFLKKHALQ